MSASAIAAILWVFVACAVAMLPMRRQFPPGKMLLFVAPALIIWIGYDFGWLFSLGALAAFLSMFRNPLRYYWRKWRGDQLSPEPEDHQ